MALGSRDRARLRQIENGLADTDPVLAETFRQWPGSGAGVGTPQGWSVAPVWMLVIFLVGAVTWVLSPVLGVMVALIGAISLLMRHVSGGPERRAGKRERGG